MNFASYLFSAVTFPILEEYVPNIHIRVDLVGENLRKNISGDLDPTAPKRPAFATGQIQISVPPLLRQFVVAVKPVDELLEPGGETMVKVKVMDQQKKPASSVEVALLVVDESVLAIRWENCNLVAQVLLTT